MNDKTIKNQAPNFFVRAKKEKKRKKLNFRSPFSDSAPGGRKRYLAEI